MSCAAWLPKGMSLRTIPIPSSPLQLARRCGDAAGNPRRARCPAGGGRPGRAPFFRPPYGAYNGTLTSLLGELGYRALVMWDVDSRDWSGLAAETIAHQVIAEASAGSVVLFHLHGVHTAEALRKVIPGLLARGYAFTTVGGLFGGDGEY
jgi:peptidoglycan/xylan/chitin deacetylase (PgdA/CDA1 family)